MLEFIGALFGLGIVAQVLFWIVVGLLFPLFWVWMLVDAVVRADTAYPSANSSEKAIWIVAMLIVQVSAIAYFFVVYRKSVRLVSAPANGPATPSAVV